MQTSPRVKGIDRGERTSHNKALNLERCAMDVERRQTARVPCLVPVQVYPEGAFQAIETLTRDIGTAGLCVFSPLALPSGCHVTIHAVFGIGQPQVTFCARTAWSQPTTSGNQFCLGLQFDHLNPDLYRRLSVYVSKLSLQPTS